MFFVYNNISFDVNERYVSEITAIKFFDKAITLSTNVDLYEIIIEDNDTAYLYLFKLGDKKEWNEWDEETIEYVDKLQKAGYKILLADEDYGEDLDVLIVYNEING